MHQVYDKRKIYYQSFGALTGLIRWGGFYFGQISKLLYKFNDKGTINLNFINFLIENLAIITHCWRVVLVGFLEGRIKKCVKAALH
jgi:hypothetical protein